MMVTLDVRLLVVFNIARAESSTFQVIDIDQHQAIQTYTIIRNVLQH